MDPRQLDEIREAFGPGHALEVAQRWYKSARQNGLLVHPDDEPLLLRELARELECLPTEPGRQR